MNVQHKYLRKLYKQENIRFLNTNSWFESDILENSVKPNKLRGNNADTDYNIFASIKGVEEESKYYKTLFYWKKELEKNNKNVYIIYDLPSPTAKEVAEINPGNYKTFNQMITDLSRKIACNNLVLKDQIIKVFVDYMINISENENTKFGKIRNQAITVICWINRYINNIFVQKEKYNNYPILIYFGVCKNQLQASILQFFSYLPLDVVLINPNLQNNCLLKDSRLFEIKYPNSIELDKFPDNIDGIAFGTVAYYAEKDLENIMYQDSGIYKLRQYNDAVAIILKTMYEEISILWNQENKFRPNFQVIENKVYVPIILAKVCGIKDGDESQYWKDIKSLIHDDTLFISNSKFYDKNNEYFDTRKIFINGKLNKNAIKNTKTYKYGIYREDMQNYMIEKLDDLIKSNIIAGTNIRGIEHNIVKVIMNLDKSVLRLIQNIDFTKKNPKIVLFNSTEQEYGLEESIILAYLYLIGFDIILFVPTGYRVIEKYYSTPLFIEHDIGEFKYDLQLPNNVKEDKSNFLKNFLKL